MSAQVTNGPASDTSGRAGSGPRSGHGVRRAALAVVAESLEVRRLLTAIAWTGGTGNWNVANHWLPAQVPVAGDAVTIPAGSTVQVSDAEAAGTVTNAGTIDFTTDAATIAGNLTSTGTIAKTGGTGTTTLTGGDQTLAVTGGTLSAQTGTLSIAEHTDLQGGTTFATAAGAAVAFDGIEVDAAGILTGTGGGHVLFDSGTMYSQHSIGSADGLPPATLDLPAGMARVTGFQFGIYGYESEIINAGTLTFTAATASPVESLDNTGTIDVTGGGDLSAGVGNAGNFVNDAGGTLDFQTDAGVEAGQYLTNKGLIEKTGGTGTSVFNNVALDNEGGSFKVTTGTLTMEGPDTLAGGTGIDVAAGATFEFDNDATAGVSNSVTTAGAVTGTGAGTVLFNSGQMYAEHQANSTDGVAPTTLDFPAGMAHVTGFAFLVYGGEAQVINAGELDYVGTADYGLLNFDNQGVMKVEGTGNLTVGDQTNFVNDTTGTIDFQTDAGVEYIDDGSGGNFSVTTKGLIEKTGGAGDSVLGSGTINYASFNDVGGSFDVESGTLTLADAGGPSDYVVGTGTVTAAPGAVFAIAGTYAIAGDPTITGGGTFEVVANGVLTGPNNDSLEPNTTPATLDFNPGTFVVAGGDLDDDTYLVNAGTIDYQGAGQLTDIDNRGTISFDAGPIRVGGGTINEAGAVMDFEGAQQILARGNNGNFQNAGTIIFNPGAGGTFDLSQINATNTGTIYAESGTLNLPWIPNQYVDAPGLFPDETGLPAGSTFVVDPGATVTVDTTPTFVTLAGTLVLGGAGASFPAYAGLNTITGHLSVLSGDTFATAGDLTNSGTLSVGGTVTVAGAYAQAVVPYGTQVGTPTLDFQVVAAAGAAAAPKLTVTGASTLSGDLTADYVNGFTGPGGAYTVASFAGGSTGAFASTAGTAPFFTPSVSATQVVLNGTAFTGTGGSTPLPVAPTVAVPTPTPTPTPTATPADLTVSAVTAPATFAPGSQQTFTWTVTNAGTGAAAGSWQDSVFLSADGAIDAASVLVGRVAHAGPLAAGASYAAALTAYMPPVVGAYAVLVEADSRGAVTNNVRTGGVAGSAAVTTAVVPALTVGTPTTGTIAAGQELIYALSLGAGADVVLNATLAAAVTANLYVSRGVLPTPQAYDFAATSPAQVAAADFIHAPTAGTYYVLLYGRPAVTTPQAFTLSPTLVPYGAATVSPSAAIAAGLATVTVSGADFTPSTQVALVAGTTVLSSTAVTFVDANTLYVTFDLDGVAAGSYGVETTQGTGGATATLAGGFTVTTFDYKGTSGVAAEGVGHVDYQLSAPTYVRNGTGTLTLFYENDGGSEVDAPLFLITSDNAGFELAGQSSFTDGEIDVLGVGPTGPAGVLAPGQSGTVSITFAQDTTGPHVASDFSAFLLDPNATTDFDALKAGLKPDTESQAAWDQTFANFDTLVGTTVGSYQNALTAMANYLGTQGIRTADAAVYLSQELLVAGDFGQIDARNADSSFGYGQTDPFDASVTLDADGDAAVGNGEALRYFQKQADGSFVAADGTDLGVLAATAAGYTLTEADGSRTLFNADGSLASYADADGNVTTATVVNGFVTALTSADGVTQLARTTAGVVTSITDSAGRTTTFGYDGDGNLISVAAPAGTTTYAYQNPASHAVTDITAPDGTQQAFGYDSFGRVSSESQGGGGLVALDGADPVTFTYDAVGRVTTTDALGHTTTLSRGDDGAVAAVTDALGNVLSAAYADGSTDTSTTDALGLGTRTTTDAAGDITALVSASGATVAIKYDAAHHPLAVTDPDGNGTTFTYDANGNLLTTTDAAHQTATQTYTAAGLLQQSTTAAGRAVHDTYDAAGQLTGQTLSDGTAASYTYDAHGNLLTATNGSGVETFTYDAADRLTRVAYSDGLSLTYTYNAGGQLARKVDQTGFATNYAYDAQGQLDELTNAAGAMLAAYSYDAAGELVRLDLGNGTYTLYGYDADGRQNDVANHAADGTITSSFLYTFDGDGQVTSVTTPAGATTYTYDVDGNLTGAVLPGGRTLTWTYDAAGNRVAATDTGGSAVAYTANDLNQYTAATGSTFAYDADGNLVSSTTAAATTTYAYNVDQQLTTFTGPSGTTTFTYDALGNRVAETVDGVTTDLLVDPTTTNGLAGQFTTAGVAQAEFVQGLGLVGESVASGAADYYAFDGAGNVAGLTGTAGAVLDTYAYLPFGQPLAATGTTANPFTYDGRDGVLGVGGGNYLTGARLYSATLGRFAQRDPLGLAGGDADLYRYVKNSPVTYVDPTGEYLAAAADGLLFLAKYGHLPLGAAENLSASLLGTIAAGSTGGAAAAGAADAAGAAGAGEVTAAGGGFVSALAANTGTYYTAAGDLLTSSAGAASFTPLGAVSAEATPVVIAGTTDVAFTTGTLVASGGTVVSVPADVAGGIAAAPIVVPVAATAGLFYGADRAGVALSKKYQELITFDPQDGVLNKKAIIQRLQRSALGRELLAAITADGTLLSSISTDTLTEIAQQVAQQQRDTRTEDVTSHDPNAIVGPSGYGTAGYVPAATVLPYEIDFTNAATATAPAQTVVVTQTLDPNLDPSTFQLGAIGFGTTTVAVPAGLQTYATTVSLSSTLSVTITASLDAATGVVTWTFTSLDPTTGDAPADPLSGFLPPDVTAPQGEGFVDYTVQPKATLATGATITAQAGIVFDANAAIATAAVVNTVDAGRPTSTVTALAATQARLGIPVAWTGSDDAGGSGIASYTVFVSVDGGPFAVWLGGTTATSAAYAATPGHTYGFYTVATDNAGNTQLTPAAAQATTAVPAIAKTLTVTKGKPARFTDAAGNAVTVTLAGPGTATLGFLTTADGDPVGFAMTGTTAATRVGVRAAGKAGTLTLGDVSAAGSLAAFTAPMADLVGSFAVTGTLGSLSLDDAADGPITAGGTGVATAFRFGTLTDVAVTTAAPVRSLSAAAWTDGPAATDALTAPSVGSLSVAGDLDAAVTLSGTGLALRSAAVRGSVTGGTWTIAAGSVGTLAIRGSDAGSLTTRSAKSLRVGGNLSAATVTLTAATGLDLASLAVTGSVTASTIAAAAGVGTVTVGGMTGSTLYAGVAAGTTGLPTAASDLASGGSIRSFTAAGRSPFAGSDVAAYAVDRLTFRSVTTDDGGTLFGVAAHVIGAFAGSKPDAKPAHLSAKQLTATATPLGGDFRLVVL